MLGFYFSSVFFWLFVIVLIDINVLCYGFTFRMHLLVIRDFFFKDVIVFKVMVLLFECIYWLFVTVLIDQRFTLGFYFSNVCFVYS